jgi:hypothetical protein
MKQRHRTRLLKQRLRRLVQQFATEEELFASIREHRQRVRDKLTKNEFTFLREAAELHKLLLTKDADQ